MFGSPPNAGRDAIEGVQMRDDGSAVLRLQVRAVPDKGKANAAVIALLAKVLGVPKSALAVTSGETARLKTLVVTGIPPLPTNPEPCPPLPLEAGQ
ncbi:MAG: DUF167 family protein [Candidatus Devosia euplotis]|nr:DUF167 family protein [Candidatus Devosia euplotis]